MSGRVSGRMEADMVSDLDDVGSKRHSLTLNQTLKKSLSANKSVSSGRSFVVGTETSQVFSRASGTRGADELDDEEELKWAALERLPTFDRLRTTILMNNKGSRVSREQVDLRTMSQGRMRSELLSKVFADNGSDDVNAKFLNRLRERIDKVGIALPTVEVRYENLNIDAKMHVGGRAVPSLPNACINFVEGALSTIGLNFAKKTDITILHDVSGVIRPGRMTLLLGPPSSGKTTLLLALAGTLDKALKVKGKITYNGHGLDEFVPEKTSAYVSQNDLHVGVMTVRETLEYSAKCQDVGAQSYELLSELTKREKEHGIHPEPDVDYYMKATSLKESSSAVITDYILKILGLDICADTLVGDELLRGISGGQKKRVTTGEMIVGPVKTLFMDEISTGLDSSTTFQIVQYLRNFTHVMEATLLISLLQPAPETYDLFDDIILLSEGQVAYQGPRENILEFFESCGFKCPDRKGVGDFLQEVTSRKDQEQYWMDKSRPYEFVPVAMFADAFKKFRVGTNQAEYLETPYEKEKSHSAALIFQKYSISYLELLKINLDKEKLLVKRNAFIYIFKGSQICLMAFIGVAVFFRTTLHRRTLTDAQIFSGALFFGLSNIMFNGYAELSMAILRLPVFYKQRNLLFFPAWSYSLASWILSIPISIMEVLTWICITYYTIGFAPNVSRFFRQLFLYFWMHQMSGAMFRMIAGASRSMVVSNTGGTFFLMAIFLLGGFIIPRGNLKRWIVWGYWLSPLSYAFQGIEVVEFLAPQWAHPYGSTSTDTLGVQNLKSVSVYTHSYWYWIAVAALIGFTFLFNGLYTLFLTVLGPLGSARAVISEEQRAETHANLTGEALPTPTPSKRSGLGSLPRSLSGLAARSRKSGLSLRSNTNGRDVEMRQSGISENGMVGAQSTRSRNSMEIDDAKGVAAKRGMTLPFQPLAISFDDVNYYVDMPAQMKAQGATEDKLQLLRGITGSFRPGVLTALVGVSGAGKTTLMDVLAGRKTGGYIEGDIRIAGYPKNQETFARISGYCEQNDIHSPQVTVHESLIYSAWLRLPREVDDHTKTQFVFEVMELVELTSLKDALVGLPGVSGLSTEQRKRLTIAVELVANPSIIFMDEPTSGLDARAAAIVMRAVRNTVDTGRTVVCTIHQPSIDIFESFDELLLLKRGGQVIYAGSLGRHSHKLVEYFEAIDGVPKNRDGYNPATWMLEVSSAAAEQHLNVDFADLYANSSLFQRNKNLVQELAKPPEGSKDLWFPTQYSQPFYSQVSSCLWKQNLTYWRSPDYNNVRMLFVVLAALLYGVIFWQLGKKRESQVNLVSLCGAIVASVLFTGVNNAATVQPVVATERSVFYRERAAGYYSAGPYAIGQVLIEIPYLLVLAVVYSVISYAMVGLEWTAVKFFWYLYFTTFSFATFTFYGMMCVGLTPNHQIAAIVAAFFYQIWFIFSGYLVPRKLLPIYVRWYYWADPVAWTLYGLIASQFGDLTTMIQHIDPTAAPETIAQFLRSFLGFKHDFLWVVAIMHLIFPVMFAFIFMLTIKYLNFQTR